MGTCASSSCCKRGPKARAIKVRPLETKFTRHRRTFSVQSWRSIPRSLDNRTGPPYKQRVNVCKAIKRDIKSGDFVGLPRDIQRLRYICGLDAEVTEESGVSITLDETTIQMILSLTRLVNVKLNHWNTDAIEVCERLISHLSPPARGKKKQINHLLTCTDLSELDVTGLNLHKEKNREMLETIIKDNKSLVSIRIDFAELENKDIDHLLHSLGRMKQLNFIGLAGNSLSVSIMEKLMLMLTRRQAFPELMWIDLRNNKDIFTIPNRMLQLLKIRWPKGKIPNFKELADGMQIVNQDQVIDLE